MLTKVKPMLGTAAVALVTYGLVAWLQRQVDLPLSKYLPK